MFRHTVPSSERTKCRFFKTNCYSKPTIYRFSICSSFVVGVN